MGMMVNSVISTASLSSSFNSSYGSNYGSFSGSDGRFVNPARTRRIFTDADLGDRASPSPNPDVMLSRYIHNFERQEDVIIGIPSETMAMQDMIPGPPTSDFNEVAAMLGKRWVKKSQTWPMDRQQVKRNVSFVSRARDWVMAGVQKDIDVS